MLSGIGICFYYMSLNQPWLREAFYGIARSVPTAPTEWFGISAISAGIFGIPLGFAVIIIVSLITPAPSREVQDLVSQVRYPDLKMA
jgi:cation/acetate symporter